MLNAFLRLLAITAGSLILIFFAVVFVRWMGFQQEFAAPPHAWFEQKYWNVYAPEKPCGKVKQPSDPQTMIMVTVKSSEGDWIIDCPENTPIDDLLKSSAHPNWILRVKAHDSANLDKLVEIVGNYDTRKKFGFVSDSQRASRFLRKKGPQWLYAADPASLLRLQIFTSLWIETAMDFWPDFVLATNDSSLPTHLSERIAKELARRQKRIVWQGDENPLIPVQGRVTTSAEH